jgi:hypothetical protein
LSSLAAALAAALGLGTLITLITIKAPHIDFDILSINFPLTLLTTRRHHPCLCSSLADELSTVTAATASCRGLGDQEFPRADALLG